MSARVCSEVCHSPFIHGSLCWDIQINLFWPEYNLRACGAHRQANCPDLNCLHFLALEVHHFHDVPRFTPFPILIPFLPPHRLLEFRFINISYCLGVPCFTSAVVRLFQGKLNPCKVSLSKAPEVLPLPHSWFQMISDNFVLSNHLVEIFGLNLFLGRDEFYPAALSSWAFFLPKVLNISNYFYFYINEWWWWLLVFNDSLWGSLIITDGNWWILVVTNVHWKLLIVKDID